MWYIHTLERYSALKEHPDPSYNMDRPFKKHAKCYTPDTNEQIVVQFHLYKVPRVVKFVFISFFFPFWKLHILFQIF